MGFFEMFFTNLVGLSISMFFVFWTSMVLFGRKPRHAKERMGKMALFTLLMVAGFAFLGVVFYKCGIFYWEYNIGGILFSYIAMAGSALYLWFLYGEDLKVNWVLAVVLEMLEEFANNFTFLFAPKEPFHLEIFHERLLYFFFTYFMTPLVQAFLVWVLYKSGVGKLFRQWMEREKIGFASLFFIELYPILSQFLYWLIQQSEGAGQTNGAVSVAYFLVVLLIFNYGGKEEMQRKQLEAQQVSLQQQNTYIETLEGLQQEMRRFRHDYKNMMSGIYLQAKEGDLESIQNFIQGMTEDFDLQVGGQIRRLTQLGNVHILEVKGLLLCKMQEMQKDGIGCELEVFRPLGKTRVRATDLCRCLGILIDNAMDEVRGKEDPQVHIMVSSQEGYTTFRIKNRLYSQVDFHRIWQQGYSTRGAGRGVGLASYRNILKRYGNIFPVTAIQDGYFVQELKIQEEV